MSTTPEPSGTRPATQQPMANERRFHELVYDHDALPFFRERWPQATFKDASDFIHEGRFEVDIDGVTSDDVYPLLIVEGWSGVCLGFELSLRLPEKRADVERWLAAAKTLKESFIARRTTPSHE